MEEEFKTNNRKMRNDSSARVPFALVAVIILIMSGFAIALISSVSYQRYAEPAPSQSLYLGDILRTQQDRIRSLAEEAVMRSVENLQTQQMWYISNDAYMKFVDLMNKNTGEQNKIAGRYVMTYSKPELKVGVVPFEYNTVNALGMKAKLRSPVYLRIAGSVDVTFTDTITKEKVLTTTVDLDKVVPTTRAFIMDQAARYQFDLSPNGLGNDILTYILQKNLDNGVTPTSDNVKGAVQFIVDLETAMLFRKTNNAALHNWIMSLPSKSNVDVYDAYKRTTGAGSGKIRVDLSEYGNTFIFYGESTKLGDTERKYDVNVGLTLPTANISIIPRQYSLMDLSSTSTAAITYDIYVRYGTVNIEGWEVNVPRPVKYKTTLSFELNARIFKFITSSATSKDLPGVENTVFFENNFGKLFTARHDVKIELKNAKNEDVSTLKDVLVDVYIDGISVGLYKPSDFPLTLKSVREGEHLVEATLMYGNGEMENGKTVVTIPKTVTKGVVEQEFNTTSGVSTSTFWSISLAYIHGVPQEQRMLKLSELYGAIAGYPFPEDIKKIDFSTNETMNATLKPYIQWCENFKEYLKDARNSVAFTYNFEGYSLEKSMVSAVSTWEELSKSMMYIRDTRGLNPQQLLNLTGNVYYNITSIPTYFPQIDQYSDIIEMILEAVQPGGVLSGLFEGMDSLPYYIELFKQFKDWYDNHSGDLGMYGLLATGAVVAFVVGWYVYAPDKNLTEYIQLLKQQYQIWKPRIEQLHNLFSSMGVNDIYGFGAVVLGKYFFGGGLSWVDYVDNVIAQLNYWKPKIIQLRGNLQSLGADNIYGYGAVLLGKYVFAPNLNWSEYIDALNSYMPDIIGLKNQFNAIGIKDIYGFAGVIACKYMFANDMDWGTYLNQLNTVWMPKIVAIADKFKTYGINDLYGFGAVILGKFVLEPNGDWLTYLDHVPTYIDRIFAMRDSFKALGINDAYGFAAVVVAKYTVAKDIDWWNYTQNVTDFWLPQIVALKEAFGALGINEWYGFAAAAIGKFVFAPDMTWADYIVKLNEILDVKRINFLKDSFKTLGVSDALGFGAVIIGKYVFAPDKDWNEYLDEAASFIGDIADLKNMLRNDLGLGNYDIYGLAAVGLGKFIFGANKTWKEYIQDVKSELGFWIGQYNDLKSMFSQIFNVLGIDDKYSYLGFAAVVAGKFLFAQDMSWKDYVSTITSYKDQLSKYLDFYKELQGTLGTGGAAAAVGAIILGKYMFAPDMGWTDYLNSVMNSYHFWAGKLQDFIGIFSRYGDQPMVFRLMFQFRDAVQLIDDTAMFFINDNTDVWSIIGKDNWVKVHDFISTYLKGIVDIINIVEKGLNLYTSVLNLIKEWKDFDDWTNVTSVLALLTDTVNVAIQAVDFLIDIVTFLNEQCLLNGLIQIKETLMWISSNLMVIANAIVAVANVVRMFMDELKANNGDIVKTLTHLFFGFDLTSAMWYMALGSAVLAIGEALAAFGISVSWIPVVGQVLLAIGAVILIIWAIFNWDDFVGMLFGGKDQSLPVNGEEVTKLKNDVTTNLNSTMYFFANVNESKPLTSIRDATIAQASGYHLKQFAAYAVDEKVAKDMETLGSWYKEYGTNLNNYTKHQLLMKWAVTEFWRQADDFVDKKNKANPTYGKHSEGFEDTFVSKGLFKKKKYVHWYIALIYVTDKNTGVTTQLRQSDGQIESFIDALNYTTVENYTIKYEIIGDKIPPQGIQDWADTMKKVGDELTYWNERMAEAKAKLDYVRNFFDAKNFTKDWGYMQIYLDPEIEEIDVSVKLSTGGSFAYAHNYTVQGTTTNLKFHIAKDDLKPYSLYLTPGTYIVSWSNPTPPVTLNGTSTTVTVKAYSSPGFNAAVVKIEVKHKYNMAFRIEDIPNLNAYYNYTYVVNNTTYTIAKWFWGFKYGAHVIVSGVEPNGVAHVITEYNFGENPPSGYITIPDYVLQPGGKIKIEVWIDIDKNPSSMKDYDGTEAMSATQTAFYRWEKNGAYYADVENGSAHGGVYKETSEINVFAYANPAKPSEEKKFVLRIYPSTGDDTVYPRSDAGTFHVWALESSGGGGPYPPPNPGTYNRQAAYNYAQQYWNKVCACGYDYNPYGGDCAHFVSECLLAGGVDNRGYGGGHDKIIVYCPHMYSWFMNQHIGSRVNSINQMDVGDIILYDWNGDGTWDHAALYIGNNQVAAHNNNHWGAYWTLGGASAYALLHIEI
ncbi:MAG: amidase domain-containing protein [Thermoplasmata archaeon]